MKSFNQDSKIKIFFKDIFYKIFKDEKTIKEENLHILEKISAQLNEENYEKIETYRKIKENNLFDEDYYLNQFETKPTIDPLLHYMYVGYSLGLNPCESFNTSYYKDSNPNVGDENPLIYFINRGINEGNIKVNPDIWQPLSINKYDVEERIKDFDEYGLNREKRSIPLIVSLTSYPKRIKELKFTVYSLLNQEVKPDKLILWLANSEFPNKEMDLPIELLKFRDNGLTIKWCDITKSYKKLIPALNEYPDCIIVTADDDLFYPEDWLKKLYEEHEMYPQDILSHRCRKIDFDGDKIKKYLDWKMITGPDDASCLNFFTTGGGVLFPPHCLDEKVFDTDLYDKLCPTGDDIWFWSMALINDTKTRVVKDNIHEITYVNPARDILFNKDTLWSYNETHNDKQLDNILNNFPGLYERIFTEYNSGKQ